MINFRMLKLSDQLLWLVVVALCLIGLLAIGSATYFQQLRSGDDPFSFVLKQFSSLLLALPGLALFAYFDYRRLKRVAPLFYLLSLIFLGAVLFLGRGGGGAQRWLMLGPLYFQPSEFSKIILIVALAAFFDRTRKITSVWQAGQLILLVLLPFLLIFRQPDLGTALVYLAILLGMLAYTGASPRLLILLSTLLLSLLLRPFFLLWLIYLGTIVLILFLIRASWQDWLLIFGGNLLVGLALPLFWGTLKAYQQQRLITFLNPGADPYGAGYHTLQSVMAIGSGGLWGRGFLRGSQTQLQFIPEQHSDFIFSVIGEEFGFLGSLVVLGLFALLTWRIITLAGQAPDLFGGALAAGVVSMNTFHFFANIGMACGILPVVGIPLPFVSFGGSSLIMNFIALGMLQSIAMRRQKIIF